MEKEKTICFTGHRPNNLPWRSYECGEQFNNFKESLKNIIVENIKKGYKYFLSGMAMGFDLISAKVILELKKEYNIKLIAVLPYKNHGKNWNMQDKIGHDYVLKNADEIIVLNEEYNKYVFFDRNKYMVEHSSKVIACYNNIKGGTLNTIKFALKHGREVEYVSLG